MAPSKDTAIEQGLGYDPRAPDVLANPYPHYRRLRESCPVVYSDAIDMYVVSKHEDIRRILRQPETFSVEGAHTSGFGDAKVLITADDPIHSRQRRLVNKAFTPRRVSALEPYIEQVANELIDSFVENASCDLVSQFAYPLPVFVISKMLGIPAADHEKFKRWADDMMRAVGNPEAYLEQAMVSVAEFAQYILKAAAKRKAAVRAGEQHDDLLTALASAEDAGKSLTEDEFVIAVLQILTAGHETTTNLIANGVNLLGDYPDQRDKLLREPALLENAVEEILRYDGPAQGMFRKTKHDVEVSGTVIPAGIRVEMLFGSANRDPEKWSNPDQFDITRPLSEVRQHLGFGFGPHACLGASLARLEGRVALGALIRRLPGLHVDHRRESTRDPVHYVRGWKSLWVKWTPPTSIK